jgi:hypothetical protein
MAFREFTDAEGFRWKAWDVTADQIHPKTRAEDYMHDLADGWLVFERADGEEKRRLCPFPSEWEASSDAQLLVLFDQAERVKRRQTLPLGSWKIGDAPVAPARHRDRSPPASPQDIPRRPKSGDKDTGGDEKRPR